MTKITFYFDENISQTAIVKELANYGIEALRPQDVGLLEEEDDEVHLTFATENLYVTVTNDRDFLRLNKQWAEEEKSHSGIVFVVRQRTNIGTIIMTLVSLFEQYEAGDLDGQVIYI